MTAQQLSLPEIEALATKAARGRGMTWGMAEEAGFATRWLCARGIDGAQLLLAYLQALDLNQWNAKAPVIDSRLWSTATGEPLCPIAAGAALCDFAVLPDGIGAGHVTLTVVAYPALLLPFLAGASVQLGLPLRMELGRAHVVVSGDDVLWLSSPQFWDCAVGQVRVCRAEDPDAPAFEQSVQPVASDILHTLNELALRTTVPPSARSRAGAGAARSDND